MAPYVIDVRKADDSRDVVHRAVQALVEGKIVAFPTETVYGLAASGLSEQAVQKLIDLKGRSSNHPFALAVKSVDDALDYVPDMSPLARRLARRCWPGPVTLVVDCVHGESLLRQLPPVVQQAVVPQTTIGLRVPAHRLITDVLRLIAGPLVLTSANRTGQPDAIRADQLEDLGEELGLILDDGPSRYGQPSSVVRVQENKFELLREGVVARSMMERLASYMILFVCTGNTCRSPMAEALSRKLLAERLGCPESDLEDRGVIVMSAGIAAMAGGKPASEAVEVMKEMKVSLEDHESQPLTDQLVQHADIILTMTRSHRAAIVGRWPEAAERVQILSGEGQDISDPIGGALEVYRSCAEQICDKLKQRMDQLDLP